MNANSFLTPPRTASLDTVTPLPSLLHPAIDPALVELQVRAAGDRAVLMRAGVFEVRLLRGPLERELSLELGRLREQRFRFSGLGTGRPTALDTLDRCCDHVIVWSNEARAIAGAARIFDPAVHRVPQGESLEALQERGPVSGHLDGPGRTLEVSRAFVAVGFAETEASVVLLRAIDAWLANATKGPRHAD
jgi:hypothetical protein